MCQWVSKFGSYCDINLGGQNDEDIKASNVVAGEDWGLLYYHLLVFLKMEKISTFFSVPHWEVFNKKDLREENNNILTRFYKIKFWPQWRNNYELIVLK